MDNYYYDTATAGLFAGIIVFGLIFAVIGYVLSSLFLMKIFEKAGVQGKWRGLDPGLQHHDPSLSSARHEPLADSVCLWCDRSAQLGTGHRTTHRTRSLRADDPRGLPRWTEAPEGGCMGRPLHLLVDRLARNQRFRQVALEHSDPARTVGWQCLLR